MVYLEADQLQAFRKKARIERISVAEMIRRCVRRGLQDQAGMPPPAPAAQVYARLIGLPARRIPRATRSPRRAPDLAWQCVALGSEALKLPRP